MGLLSLLLWGILLLLLYFIVSTFFSIRKMAEDFRKQNVPHLGAGLARTWKLLTGSGNIVSYEFEVYEEACATKAPLAGVSDIFGGSGITITDLDLVRNIYVKDFNNFVNRRPIDTSQSNKYFKKMLIGMENEQWKAIRAKLSPCFTSGKIKKMFQIFKTSSERLENYLKNKIISGAESKDIDFCQVFPKYAMDVIASAAFGIESKSWDVELDKKSQFEEMGNRFLFNFDAKAMLKYFVMTAFPKIADIFGLEAFDYESTQYFASVIGQVIKTRRETGERREDFLQLMLDAQQGLLKADDEYKEVMNGSNAKENLIGGGAETKIHFDDDDIIANGQLFLLAGFDTSQSVLLFAIYSLALETEVQEKLYEEVKQVKEKHGGMLTYEALLEMSYLDLVIREALRLYPPSVATERICTKDYPVPGLEFVIKKGTIMDIPVHPVHLDPKYYPDPKKFIPERFTAEEKAKRHPYAFAPFGQGPRSCIAMRFALVSVKAVIAELVGSFQFAPCAKTMIPMEFGSGTTLKPKTDMWIKVTPRN